MKYRLPPKKKRSPHHYRKHLTRRIRKPIPRTVVPSFFTLMNLLSGFVAIIQIHEGRLDYGAWFIILAGLCDALDGLMARLANATSALGIELDSLADIVSFGIAPGFLLYNFAFHQMSIGGIIISALPPICGAIRLARFNIETSDIALDHFKGLPIPAQAGMIVAFYLTFHNDLNLFSFFQYGVNNVVIPMVIILSGLMVSTVPFDKIPRLNRTFAKKHKGRLLLFLGYILAIIFFQEYGLMAVFTIFIAKGLVLAAVRFWREIKYSVDEEEEDTMVIER